MLFAPPPPSSAGWNTRCTVPVQDVSRCSSAAAPSSDVVWPSWPQACITPGLVEAWARPVVSLIGSASMSARSPTLRLRLAARDRRDDAVAADTGDEGHAEFPQLCADEGGGLLLVQGEFRMRMQMSAPGRQGVGEGFVHCACGSGFCGAPQFLRGTWRLPGVYRCVGRSPPSPSRKRGSSGACGTMKLPCVYNPCEQA